MNGTSKYGSARFPSLFPSSYISPLLSREREKRRSQLALFLKGSSHNGVNNPPKQTEEKSLPGTVLYISLFSPGLQVHDTCNEEDLTQAHLFHVITSTRNEGEDNQLGNGVGGETPPLLGKQSCYSSISNILITIANLQA